MQKHVHPLFRSMPGRYDNPEIQKLAGISYIKARRILNQWVSQKLQMTIFSHKTR